MRHFNILGFCFLAVFGIFSCDTQNTEETATITDSTEMLTDVDEAYSYFGDTVYPQGAFSLTELEKELSKDGKTAVKIKATIDEVCQAKGCWMNVQLPSGEPMRIKFKDYAFFVPKDAGGREAIMEGIAYYDTVSVEEQRHYAEDAGDTEEEIATIKEPKHVLAFEAEGVAIKENN